MLNFFFLKLEIEDLDVLFLMLRLATLWNDRISSINTPSKNDLELRFPVFLGKVLNVAIFPEVWHFCILQIYLLLRLFCSTRST
jgi:hypothetical protein